MSDRLPGELHNQGGRGAYRYNRGSPMVERTKNPPPTPRPKKQTTDPAENLTAILAQKVVGQPAATRVIVPYIQMFQAGLAPEGRPVGVFLLLGPTGTGKTKTVEALADILSDRLACRRAALDAAGEYLEALRGDGLFQFAGVYHASACHAARGYAEAVHDIVRAHPQAFRQGGNAAHDRGMVAQEQDARGRVAGTVLLGQAHERFVTQLLQRDFGR